MIDKLRDRGGSFLHTAMLTGLLFFGGTHMLSAASYVHVPKKAINVEVKLFEHYKTSEEIISYAEEQGQVAFITTGTFMDSEGEHSVGLIKENGLLITRGIYDGGVYLVADGYGAYVAERITGAEQDVVGGLVSLVLDGKISIDESEKRNIDPALSRQRIAIGVKDDVMVVYEDATTIAQLAEDMLQLGVTDAVATDGGNSSFFYSNGEIIVEPNRSLRSVIIGYYHTGSTPPKTQTIQLKDFLP